MQLPSYKAFSLFCYPFLFTDNRAEVWLWEPDWFVSRPNQKDIAITGSRFKPTWGPLRQGLKDSLCLTEKYMLPILSEDAVWRWQHDDIQKMSNSVLLLKFDSSTQSGT